MNHIVKNFNKLKKCGFEKIHTYTMNDIQYYYYVYEDKDEFEITVYSDGKFSIVTFKDVPDMYGIIDKIIEMGLSGCFEE